jgi:DNA-damage-inducible protein D
MSDAPQNGFETLSRQNGSTWWSAREFMLVLGYDSWDEFHQLIRKTIQAYLSSDWFDFAKEFKPYEYHEDEYLLQDYKLSRFACFILAMNGNTAYPEVLDAQRFLDTVNKG